MKPRLCRLSQRALGLVSLLLVWTAAPAAAQIPDTFTNLHVLSADIGQGELIGVMRNIAGALGVRCGHCHVGGNPATLEGVDFATDASETKRVARAMMRMTREINERLLPESGREDLLRVSCMTCHHGLTRPQTLQVVLMTAVEAGGVETAIGRYQELREEYHGRGVYDFSFRTLNGLSEELADSGRMDDAIAMARFNVELHGDHDNTHYLLGDLHRRNGDTVAALASFERALALQPDNSFYQTLVRELKPQ